MATALSGTITTDRQYGNIGGLRNPGVELVGDERHQHLLRKLGAAGHEHQLRRQFPLRHVKLRRALLQSQHVALVNWRRFVRLDDRPPRRL